MLDNDDRVDGGVLGRFRTTALCMPHHLSLLREDVPHLCSNRYALAKIDGYFKCNLAEHCTENYCRLQEDHARSGMMQNQAARIFL